MTNPPDRRLEVEVEPGTTLVVHELGGSGEPLLLCHATGFHGRVWAPLAHHLADRRCLAVDFRGFGDSTPPTEAVYDWQQLGDDVLAVIEALDLDGVEAVGHSMGGAALLIAALTRPGALSQLFVFEPIIMPGGGPANRGPNPLADGARRRRSSFPSVDAAIERYREKATLGTLDPACLREYVEHGFRTLEDGTIELKATGEHEARHYESGGAHATFDRLGEIEIPVTVAWGDDGHPATFAPLVADALPHGAGLHMSDLGHFGPLEDPRRMATAIETALHAGRR